MPTNILLIIRLAYPENVLNFRTSLDVPRQGMGADSLGGVDKRKHGPCPASLDAFRAVDYTMVSVLRMVH